MAILVGAHKGDTLESAEKLAQKIANLRIFNDEAGKINLSLKEVATKSVPHILAISNFTVYGDVSKNRRPSFTEAASYEEGEKLYSHFVQKLKELGFKVETGIYGAEMEVELVNDGPVTLIVEV
jgi:D-tyrosyl-tRNA(Tyr) deacylase